MKVVVASGAVGPRSDASFENIFTTTTVASANYIGIDRLIETTRAEGLDYLWLSIGPYVSTTDPTWEALAGVYGSADRLVKKRMPAGTANACWNKLVECIDALLAYVRTKWMAEGGDPNNVYFEIFQEWCVGASDGPQTTDTVSGGAGNARADAIASMTEGTIDTDANWDAMSGINAGYANVRGAHEIAEYLYNNITVPSEFHWVAPALECENSTTTTREIATMFLPGYTWQQAIIDHNGHMEVDAHSYFRGFGVESSKRAETAGRLHGHTVRSIVTEMQTAHPSILTSTTVYHCTECAASLASTFGSAPDTTWSQEAHWEINGEIHNAVLTAINGFVGIEEAMADAVLGVETYSIINLAGNTTVGLRALARASNADVSVSGSPQWGGSWVQNSNEVPA